MDLRIPCVCGNGIQCDRLDLIVALPCPVCGREIDVEYLDTERKRRRLTLTVVEGPQMSGQRFVVPIGEDLLIGSTGQRWLRLVDGAVDGVHCRLHATAQGVMLLEDLKSSTGSWIGAARIVTGEIAPGQQLRIGQYSLRLDREEVERPRIANQLRAHRIQDEQEEQAPRLSRVAAPGFSRWIISQRFNLARGLTSTFGWLAAWLHFRISSPHWGLDPAYSASICIAGGVALTWIAGRMSMVRQGWNLAGAIVPGFLAIIDTALLLLAPTLAGGAVCWFNAVMCGRHPPSAGQAVAAFCVNILTLIGLLLAAMLQSGG